MNCTQTHEHFDDYLDGTLAGATVVALEAHLTGCATCRTLVARARECRLLLCDKPVPPPTDGFTDRVLRVAAERHLHRQHRSGFIRGFGSAMVAGLAIWVAVGLFPMSQAPNSTPTPELPGVTIALHGTQQVKVAFHTAKALSGAKITLQLPENVELAGYPGERELAWNTDLVEGDNVLSLPIVGQQMAEGVLVARIEHANKVRTLRIKLAVGNAGVSNVQIHALQSV